VHPESVVTRFVALIRDPTPLGGVCPACDAVMDESGCRLGDHFTSRNPARTGVAQVVEVFCKGMPSIPAEECPACP
jgi:hypothetical protein